MSTEKRDDMGSVGIIAEYNPFHNGHLHHLKEIKKKYPTDTVILVMSGNFSQRGEPTIIDKWTRAKIALQAGIDLVIEIPYVFVTQSADYFSYAAVTLLEHLQVEKFVFGSESDNIEDLKEIAKAQINHEDFDKLVKIYSKFGNNYPTALSLALKDITGKEINTPNDILGISYLKTIEKYKYNIKPITIKRINNYHEDQLTGSISSATAIRKSLLEKQDITNSIPSFTKEKLTNLHFIKDYFPYLKYKVITSTHLEKYHLVDTDLAIKLKKEILTCDTYEELIQQIKSKHQTYSKISRALLQILCSYTKEEATKQKEITYIRLLGFNDTGRAYLNKYKKKIALPIISKITKHKDSILETELKTTKIYTLPYPNQKIEFKKEYQNTLYIKGE